jgi:hypothetical protein
MGNVALSQHTSLDGVMQSPGPADVPFRYRGWIMDFDTGPEGDRFQLEQAQNSEALLLGRVTYANRAFSSVYRFVLKRPGSKQARCPASCRRPAGA